MTKINWIGVIVFLIPQVSYAQTEINGSPFANGTFISNTIVFVVLFLLAWGVIKIFNLIFKKDKNDKD